MPASIMIVDDMAVFREPIALALENAGYRVRQAANGEDALHAMELDAPDLLLLDVTMPDMDGLTVLERLRGTAYGRHLSVIMFTGLHNRETIVKAAKLGVRDYLLKSDFSLNELLARVKRCTGKNEGPQAVPPRETAARLPVRKAEVPRSDPVPAPSPAEPKNGPVQHTQVQRPTANTEPPKSTSSSETLTSAVAPQAAIPQTGRGAAPSTTAGEKDNPVLLTREQTRSRLAQIVETRTCAGVVAQVLALANSPNSEVNDLVRVIESDPILASRVLQMANSPMFRQRYSRISNVEEAVRKVGMRAIANTVISIGVFQSFPPNATDGFNTLRCWQHCFAVSAILRAMLDHKNDDEREYFALVGLCHDLGEIALRQHFAPEYQRILQRVEKTGQSIASVEATALSMRHSEIVNEILTRLGLPANIVVPIMRFHEGTIDAPGESAQPVRLLQLANWIAHGMMLVSSSEATLSPVSKSDINRALGKDPERLNVAALRAEILATTNMLARLPAVDEERFMQTLYPPTASRLWYARHPSYADLDPLQEILSFLANVQCETRLPQTKEELAATDFLLIVSPFIESQPAVSKDIRALQKSPGYRGQPILILLNNAAGTVKLPGAQLEALPVSLRTLAQLVKAQAQA